MGLRNNLERLDQRLHRKPSSSGSLSKLAPPLWYDPDRPSWIERQDKQRYAEQNFYSSYHNSYAPVYPNAGGGSPVPNPGVPVQYPAGSVSSLYNEGWHATSVPCSTCGNLMLEQYQQQIYWCSTCCQKTTRQALHEKASRAETALEWLSKQIAKYTGKQ